MEMPLLCGWCLIIDLSPLLEAERAVTWSKIRGFTLELLERLASSTATTTSLAHETGESTPYVYRYLKNMQKYGLVDVRNYLWHITDTGSLLLSLTEVERKKKEDRKKNERKKKEYDKTPLIYGQIRLEPWLKNHSLSECEKEVVDTLISHLNRTNTPFLYLTSDAQLASDYDPKTLQLAMQSLRQEGVIYLIRDPALGARKLGLKKAFIEKLRYLQSNCSGGETNLDGA